VTRVDGHAHVFRAAALSRRGVDELVPADREAPVEAFIATLEANAIDQAVLVPLDEHDDYVAEAVRGHPGRFAAVAVASAVEQGRTDADPVAALESRRERLPFSAVRTMWLGEPGRPIAESPMLPALEWCESEGLCLWSYLPPGQFPFLSELARRMPGLRIVLNHFGFTPHDLRVDEHARPRFDERLPLEQQNRVAALAEAPNVFVMLSGHYAVSEQDAPYPDLVGVTRHYVDSFGPERLLWGSDMPWPEHQPGYAALLGAVDAALPDLDAAGRERIFGGTARALLDFV
jgi:predicted TIM-barrel fold metal-dependent hydrolase